MQGKNLSPKFFPPSPPPRAHPGHSISGCTNRTIAAFNFSIFCRTRERPSSGNEDTINPVDGTGSPVKRGSGWAAGPEGPRPRFYPRSQALDEKLCQASGILPGGGDPNFTIDGDVAASYWPFWAARQSILSSGWIWWIESTNVLRCFYTPATRTTYNRGVRGSSGVWGTAEECGERRVVDFEAKMSGPARAKGGGTNKTRWKWEWSQVKRWGSWKRRIFQH